MRLVKDGEVNGLLDCFLFLLASLIFCIAISVMCATFMLYLVGLIPVYILSAFRVPGIKEKYLKINPTWLEDKLLALTDTAIKKISVQDEEVSEL